MINETQKRRLIGLIVLLVIVFALSELLPHNLPESGEQGVPSTTLPLAANPADGTPAPAAPTDDSAQAVAPAAPAQAPQSASAPPLDASAPPPSISAAPSRPARPSVMPAEVSSMPSGAALPEPAAAAAAPPKPAASKPAEVKPQEIAKVDSKPPAPVLKLSQSLPSPTAKLPPPEPAPKTKLSPPPVPPVPRLATSVQAPPPPVAAGQAKLWYVQIGSFADQGNAQTTLNLLQNIGFRGESKAITSASGSALYRVRLGPFPSEAVAQQALAKVSHQGYPQARVLSEAGGKP